MDPTTGGDRSPISPYALTLDELKALGPGARIVFFYVASGPSEVRVVTGLDDHRIYSRPETSIEGPDHNRELYLTDAGLVRTAGGWNQYIITIRAENADSMPAPNPKLTPKRDARFFGPESR